LEEQFPTISAEKGARAPSECWIGLNSTTNWKFTIEVKVTINTNAWKVVEPNRAPSESDSTINLRDKLGVIMCAS
jgi:hypothetical protein